VVDEEGKQLGIMDVAQALAIGEERELDLVEIAPTASPPTCKLMDYGKFKYQQTKKSRQQKKSVHQRKEVRLRPKTEEHDFQVKVERARRFIAKGHKVLVTMIFRGREAVHMENGKQILLKFAQKLDDCAKVEKEPSREARNKMDMILTGR
jgi:translation initiation factor IF-3